MDAATPWPAVRSNQPFDKPFHSPMAVSNVEPLKPLGAEGWLWPPRRREVFALMGSSRLRAPLLFRDCGITSRAVGFAGEFPRFQSSSTALGLDPVLGRQTLGRGAVLDGPAANGTEGTQAARGADGRR